MLPPGSSRGFSRSRTCQDISKILLIQDGTIAFHMQEEISAENLNATKSQNSCEKESAKRVLYSVENNKQAARIQQISLGMPSLTLFTVGTISLAASYS